MEGASETLSIIFLFPCVKIYFFSCRFCHNILLQFFKLELLQIVTTVEIILNFNVCNVFTESFPSSCEQVTSLLQFF